MLVIGVQYMMHRVVPLVVDRLCELQLHHLGIDLQKSDEFNA
jgi:hypothetical protein